MYLTEVQWCSQFHLYLPYNWKHRACNVTAQSLSDLTKGSIHIQDGFVARSSFPLNFAPAGDALTKLVPRAYIYMLAVSPYRRLICIGFWDKIHSGGVCVICGCAILVIFRRENAQTKCMIELCEVKHHP
jgi:hypothetical protein